MNRLFRSCLPFSLYFLIPFGCLCAQAQKWTQPTPEELSMTEQKGAPGADAVYLYDEEITNDDRSTFSYYRRIKILQDKGKNLAVIRLVSSYRNDGTSTDIGSISARTIHADGTVIPMIEPPIEEKLYKGSNGAATSKTYKLPQPEVGSILEYRYTIHLDNHIAAPTWNIQGRFYKRKSHYEWVPTSGIVTQKVLGQVDRKIDAIAWVSQLPSGVQIRKSTSTVTRATTSFALDITDVPPLPEAEDMPPASSFAFSVRFYYTPYSSPDAFWKNVGTQFAQYRNEFTKPGPVVKAAVSKLVAPGDTPEQKLRKFYAAVMELGNANTEQQQGVPWTPHINEKPIKTADDVLLAKRGSNDELNSLFIVMARAADIKAYPMRVANRDAYIFNSEYMTAAQLYDDITVVNLNGKERYLDPGTRYCPYGHLAWRHSAVVGLKLAESGPAIVPTPGEPIAAHQVQRVADLKMNEQGEVSGTIKFTYLGTAGIDLRQMEVIKGDIALRERVKETMSKMLPKSMHAELASITKLKEYEEPLIIVANVSGKVGTSEGARLSIDTDIFQAQSEQRFQSEKREQPVYFDTSETDLDAIGITFPSSFKVVSLPVQAKENLKGGAAYDLSAESTLTSVLIHRNYQLGRRTYPVSDYPDVRAFYAKIAAKDREPIVLQHSAATP
jgi:transglutaminase-like putative cysteine protease